MGYMFFFEIAFNKDISKWVTSKVTKKNMCCKMVHHVSMFNQIIGSWNTHKDANMSFMFLSMSKFNKAVGSWT